MGLYSDIGDAWKEAMKARDPKKDVLASIRTEVKNKIINTRSDATAGEPKDKAAAIDAPDATVLDVLGKMAKQRKEAIDEFKKGGRQDLVDKEAFELSVIESFLPKALSAEEVLAAVKTVVAELGAAGPKDMGRVMKAAMDKLKGKADGKDVQTAVKTALGA